jgi:hypothetical protein
MFLPQSAFKLVYKNRKIQVGILFLSTFDEGEHP